MDREKRAQVLQGLAELDHDRSSRGEIRELISSGRIGDAERRVLQAIADQVREGKLDLDQAHWRYKRLEVEPDDFMSRYYDR